MSRRRKIQPLRLVLIILIFIALGFIAFFGIKLVIDKVSDVEIIHHKEETIKVEPSSNEETQISIEDYVVYIDEDKELGFNFIIADLKFSNKKNSINYDIGNLSTAEKVNLGSISTYEEKLISCGYDISKLGYASRVLNEQKGEEVAKVFIPYTKVKGELCVYNGEVLKFDLNKNNIKASSLKLSRDVESTVVESENYKLTILNSYIEDSMFRNDDRASFPSTIDIYAFIIRVNDVNSSNLIVEDAKYIPQNSSIEIKALEKEYSSAINENIIGKKLNTGDEYSLFFAITNPTDSLATFGGKVLIKFENDSTWLEIKTEQMTHE